MARAASKDARHPQGYLYERSGRRPGPNSPPSRRANQQIQPCVAKTCKDEKVFSDQGRKKNRVTWEARIVDFQLLRSTIDCPQPRGKAAFQCRYFDISFFDTGESR